jgi:hypothetical protein
MAQTPIDPGSIADGRLANGNAVLKCKKCTKLYDKGAPPQPGQDDSQYVCESCNTEANYAAIAAAAPTLNLTGG